MDDATAHILLIVGVCAASVGGAMFFYEYFVDHDTRLWRDIKT